MVHTDQIIMAFLCHEHARLHGQRCATVEDFLVFFFTSRTSCLKMLIQNLLWVEERPW